MKVFIGALIVLCTMAPAHGQSIAPSVYSSSGTVYTSSNAQLSWTMGESMVSSFTVGSSRLTEGFQQPKLTVVAVDPPVLDWQVEVFPNPVQHDLTLQFPETVDGPFQVELFNVAGQVLLEQPVEVGVFRTQLDLSGVADGHYYLRVTHPEFKTVHNFKVQKVN